MVLMKIIDNGFTSEYNNGNPLTKSYSEENKRNMYQSISSKPEFYESDTELNIVFIYSFNPNNLFYITSLGCIIQIDLEKNKLISKKKYNEPTIISNFIIQNGKILCIYNNKILKLIKI